MSTLINKEDQENIKTLMTSREQGYFLDAIYSSLYVTERVALAKWASDDLHPVFPHESLFCCAGEGDLVGVKDQYSVYLNDYPQGYVEEMKNSAGYIASPVLDAWWKNKQPVLFDPERPQIPYTDDWYKIFQKYKVSSLALHGTLDRDRRNLCFYSFARIQTKLTEKQAFLLQIIIPHLNQALQRVLESEGWKRKLPSAIRLTEKEQELLYWMKQGKTAPEIAIILRRSHHTIRNQIKKIFDKLEVSSRAQAVAKAMELSLL